MRSETVTIPVGEETIPGFLVVPDGKGPWPGVVVVHEAFGVDDNMRYMAQRMASLGYLVMLPDLYSRGGARKCLRATFRALRDGEGQAFRDVEAAKAMLAARPDCTGKFGVIGFCMGGGFALQMANRGYDVASVNYGVMPRPLEDILDGACPIVGTYGGRDRSLKGAAAKVEAALTERGIPHDIKEYPNANHAFMDPGPAGPKVLQPVMQKVVGYRHYPDESEDAWRRIEAFFNQHLRP